VARGKSQQACNFVGKHVVAFVSPKVKGFLMQTLRTWSVPTTFAVLAFFLVGCGSLGVSRSGKQFNYDNVSKLQEGVTTKSDVKQLLSGESYEATPTNEGKDSTTGYTWWLFDYSETARGGAWLSYIPFLRGISLGKTTVTNYTCRIYFDGEVVARYDYNKTETGSESAGI
jgi:hypothetical protein